jgi:hypothetical protein
MLSGTKCVQKLGTALYYIVFFICFRIKCYVSLFCELRVLNAMVNATFMWLSYHKIHILNIKSVMFPSEHLPFKISRHYTLNSTCVTLV